MLFEKPCPGPVLIGFASQCSYRTCVNALTAEFAVQGLFKGRAYFGFKPSPEDINCTNTLKFTAYPYTFTAENTPVRVSYNKGASGVSEFMLSFTLETAFRGAVLKSKVLEFALSGFITDRAV
jgi:hypothetical protein